MFFKIALQAAIAFQSGIRFMIVDPLDEMDENERAKAFVCIKRMLDAGALDQAILIGHDLRKEAIPHEGVQVLFVENGTVGVL